MDISGNVGSVLNQKVTSLWSIEPTLTVYEAIEMMAAKGVGALPVMHEGRLMGMISERDYTRKVILKGKSSRSTPVSEIMTAEPIVASPSDSVVECMAIMTERRIRHLPVLQDGAIIGIISIGDLVKWIMSAQTATIDQLTKYMYGE